MHHWKESCACFHGAFSPTQIRVELKRVQRERGGKRLWGWRVEDEKEGGVGGDGESGGVEWYHLNWFHDLGACILSRFLTARLSEAHEASPSLSLCRYACSSQGTSQPLPWPLPLSYLPGCHTYSASSQKRWVSSHLFSLSFHLLPFPSLVISVCISLHISHFVLIFPSTLFSLSVNDFSATSHIFSSLQPPFLSLLSLFFLLAIRPLSLSLWLECHLMRPGLRAAEYRCAAAVHPGEDVRERDRPSSH